MSASDRFAACAAALLLAVVVPAHCAVAADPAPVPQRIVRVDTPATLRAAVQAAAPGDAIVLAPGVYLMDGDVSVVTPGTASAPIAMRAETARASLLRFGTTGVPLEGFRVRAAWWRFEGLDIEGACASDSDCEHAFHLAGDADHVVIRDNRIRDFNAQIKSNGLMVGTAPAFPDDVLIERNWLYDTRPRQTSNPVTKLDVVGGRRWVVRANTIFDFHKQAGDGISYGLFLKGNSRQGLVERNLVRCNLHDGSGTTIGLSFGGGGTGTPYCEEQNCEVEHRGGIMRNNLVMDCSDVGIYLNRAAESHVHHNTLYATWGIDVRFPTSSADLRNNLLGGTIRNRDGAISTSAGNVTGVTPAQFAAWFVDPANADFSLLDGSAVVDQGVAAPLVTDDFCGVGRLDGAPDVGALEYGPGPACTLDMGGGTPYDRIFRAGFE